MPSLALALKPGAGALRPLAAIIAGFSWDSAFASPAAVAGGPAAPQVTSVHERMRRCVVNDAGQVVYYLHPTDSTKKTDGSPAVLTGEDGQVMVEIPKFYARRLAVTSVSKWETSLKPTTGFDLHPAFLKDGVEVPFRYCGAYDACVYDTSAGAYVNGLNLDNADALYDYAADKLSSVSGKYPGVGITRAQARRLAANRGPGWRQLDFWLVQAVQLLYLVEWQSFYSQNILGAGNTNGSYLASSSLQTDSPHTIAGASNSIGNGSTNTVSGAGVNAKPGTSFMCYRGIENWFGNAWNWVDGFNVLDNQAWVSNTTAHFADDTTTNYQSLGATMPASSGYPTNVQPLPVGFLPASLGGSSSTYLTDYYWAASGWRVALFGGSAGYGTSAGGFYWYLYNGWSDRGRSIAGRLAL